MSENTFNDPAHSSKLQNIKNAWPIYSVSFPECEKRSLRAYAELCAHEDAFVPDIFSASDRIQALLFHWKTDTFHYIEHFAVAPDLRNAGLGAHILQNFIQNHDNLDLVLEVDAPEDDIKRRRIEFYKRNGLILNDFSFIHPGYKTVPSPYELCLMTTRPWTTAQCHAFVQFVLARPLLYID